MHFLCIRYESSNRFQSWNIFLRFIVFMCFRQEKYNCSMNFLFFIFSTLFYLPHLNRTFYNTFFLFSNFPEGKYFLFWFFLYRIVTLFFHQFIFDLSILFLSFFLLDTLFEFLRQHFYSNFVIKKTENERSNFRISALGLSTDRNEKQIILVVIGYFAFFPANLHFKWVLWSLIYLFIHSSIYLFICKFIYLFIYLFVNLFIYKFIYLFIYWFIDRLIY